MSDLVERGSGEGPSIVDVAPDELRSAGATIDRVVEQVGDILLDHPSIAALFQQAMQGDRESTGNRLMMEWLDHLFIQGIENLEGLAANDTERAELALNVIAMFNLTTGYFLSQRAFDTMAEGDLHSPENITRQKTLLRKFMRAMLVGPTRN